MFEGWESAFLLLRLIPTGSGSELLLSQALREEGRVWPVRRFFLVGRWYVQNLGRETEV